MFESRLSKGRVAGALALMLAGLLSVQAPAQAAESEAAGKGLPESRDYTRTRATYEAPALTLRNRFEEKVRLDNFLARDRPVLMQFIFTSCATICPVMSATFAQAQSDLLEAAPDTRLISISIDPEYDTPERLRAYAKRHNAGEAWTFLTGQYEDVFTIVRAFDAIYEGNNKMYHEPYTYLRAAPGEPWVRINGLVSARTLLEEYRGVLARAEKSGERQSASAADAE